MYMPLTAPEAGRISFIKSEGSMLASGDVIARMVLDDPSQVKTASLYRGKFPKMEPPHPEHNKPHLQLQDYLDTIRSVMAGYCREEVSRIVSEMTALMQRYSFTSAHALFSHLSSVSLFLSCSSPCCVEIASLSRNSITSLNLLDAVIMTNLVCSSLF